MHEIQNTYQGLLQEFTSSKCSWRSFADRIYNILANIYRKCAAVAVNLSNNLCDIKFRIPSRFCGSYSLKCFWANFAYLYTVYWRMYPENVQLWQLL